MKKINNLLKMYKGKIQSKILRNPVWISIFVLLSIIIIFISASLVLYNHTVALLTENLRERLLSISITAAANIDSKDLEVLQAEQDWEKPEWARVVNVLHKAKYSNKNIVFMYIFRYTKDPNNDPKNMEFVGDADSADPYANINNDPTSDTISASSCPKCVDSNRDGKIEPDGPDKLQWPGQPWPEGNDIPEAYEAYNGPITVKDIYTDNYGSVLTGFAPIKDENGNTVAVLGTDIKADDFFTTTRQTLYPFLIFGLFLVSVIIIFNILLIRSIKKELFQREKIEVLNKELERAYAIEKKANEELEKLDEYKNDFLRQTQHDLRRPLTVIMGYCDLLLSGTFGKQPKKSMDVIKKMQIVTQDKTKDINNFLDTEQFKIGKGVVLLKPGVELLPILSEIISVLNPGAQSKGIYLKLEKPEKIFTVIADREKLKSALFNIIDNSVKYTLKGGVDIKIENHNKVKIIVSDTGIGIPQDKIKNIFETQFERMEQAKETAIGSGVGLYLSSQIIKLHNGKIWVESKGQNQGSTFYIELPIS